MRRRSPNVVLCLGSTLVAGVLASLTPTEAQAGPSDNSSSRPFAAQLGLGVGVGIPGGGAFGRAPIDFQYHFRGGDVGPAIGAWLPLHFDSGVFGMNVGPMFLWDFRVGQAGNAKLYLGPLAATGYGFSAATHGRGAAHFWFLTVGAQFRALWNDRVGLFVRPATFDLWLGNGLAVGNWTATAGLALAF